MLVCFWYGYRAKGILGKGIALVVYTIATKDSLHAVLFLRVVVVVMIVCVCGIRRWVQRFGWLWLLHPLLLAP